MPPEKRRLGQHAARAKLYLAAQQLHDEQGLSVAEILSRPEYKAAGVHATALYERLNKDKSKRKPIGRVKNAPKLSEDDVDLLVREAIAMQATGHSVGEAMIRALAGEIAEHKGRPYKHGNPGRAGWASLKVQLSERDVHFCRGKMTSTVRTSAAQDVDTLGKFFDGYKKVLEDHPPAGRRAWSHC
eukprot:m.505756 g.505756  ORF g.505756 m.505756 type:complete len:186 (-) comp79827_c0_seq1:52-609(-)